MVRACHMPQQPLQKHPSRHLGGWAMQWSAEEMLDGQHQKVDIPAYARSAHKGLLQKRLEENLFWIVPNVPPNNSVAQGPELNWNGCCLLCVTAVMQGWNRYQNKSQHRKLTLKKKIFPLPLQYTLHSIFYNVYIVQCQYGTIQVQCPGSAVYSMSTVLGTVEDYLLHGEEW